MYIAHQLKQKNMAEYLLYMWQVEDIIRAMKADMNLIQQHVIAPMQLPADKMLDEVGWYESMVDMMRREGVMEKGHIALIQNILHRLEEEHDELLTDPEHPSYRAAFYQLLPSITMLKVKSDNPTQSDLSMCFVFLYGILNLKRQNRTISPDTELIQKRVSKLIAYLCATIQ